MLRSAEQREEPTTRLADLSIILRKFGPSSLMLHLGRNPTGILAKICDRFGELLRHWVRTDVVRTLTAVQCYMIAHSFRPLI